MVVLKGSLSQHASTTGKEGLTDKMVAEPISVQSLFNEDSGGSPANAAFDFTLLALGSIKGLGQKGIISLFDALKGNLGKVWRSPSGLIHDALLNAKVPAADRVLETILKQHDALFEQAADQLEKLSADNVHIIHYKDLPRSLKKIPDYPRWLFVQGNPMALYQRPHVAVVGTRQPSMVGRRAASYIGRLLAAYPLVLVSGLAEGIDEEAHNSTLVEGATNVAFLGHGINFTFPASTKDIRNLIISRGGAVATEYLPHEHYQKPFFVERNRLQAALADLVIPVEANVRGGTAHTIRFARKYEKPIVGVRWKGANGVLEELEKNGSPIIEIFTNAGSQQLDQLFRQLAKKARRSTYSLSLLERRAIKEIKSRSVTPTDIHKLIRALRKLSKEK